MNFLDPDPRHYLIGSTIISTVSYFTEFGNRAVRGVTGTGSTGVAATSGKAFSRAAFLLARRSLAVPLSAFYSFP